MRFRVMVSRVVVSVMTCGLITAAVGALAGTLHAANKQSSCGVIPEGVWQLNSDRSHELEPGGQTLWVIRDDGSQLAWVNVQASVKGQIHISSWNGHYGGPAVPVAGSQMIAKLVRNTDGTIHNFGNISGQGPYEENCKVVKSGKRLICNGHVDVGRLKREWKDVFDWVDAGPFVSLRHHAPCRNGNIR